MDQRDESFLVELERRERRLHRVADALAGDLPNEDISNFRSLVDAGEPGVALENLCSQIFEYDVTITSAVYNEIIALGRAMKLDESWWSILSVHEEE